MTPQLATSGWPLPPSGVRFLLPSFLVESLQTHPLAADCHPLALGYYPHAHQHRMARAEPDNYLLLYCHRGAGSAELEGQRWPVPAGSVVLLPPGRAHAYEADPANPWSIYWVHFAGRAAASHAEWLGRGQVVQALEPSPAVVAEFETLLRLRQSGYSLRSLVAGACRLKALLTLLAAQPARVETRRGDLQAALQLMQHRVQAQLSLDELAEAAGLSRFHLVRKFHEVTGHSPIQHFIHLKMQAACQRLDGSHDSVKAIAVALGYDDAYYFSRLFKRVIGLSPQQYRNSRSA